MKSLLVAVALLLASGSHGFNVSPRLSKLQSFRSVTSLQGTTTSSTDAASVNGDTKSVDELAAEMLDSSRSAATAQQPIIINIPPPSPQSNATDSSQSSLVYFAIAFVGLPIWLLLSSQVFGGVQQQQQIQPTVTQPAMVQPTSTVVTLPKEEVIPSTPSSTAVVSQPITKAEVRGLFNLWNDALHTLGKKQKFIVHNGHTPFDRALSFCDRVL